MVYDPTTDTGVPHRPAGEDYLQVPYGSAEATRAPRWVWGSGSPEGAVTGIPGDLYTDQDGGVGATLYVKESGTGNTGWAAK